MTGLPRFSQNSGECAHAGDHPVLGRGLSGEGGPMQLVTSDGQAFSVSLTSHYSNCYQPVLVFRLPGGREVPVRPHCSPPLGWRLEDVTPDLRGALIACGFATWVLAH